MLHQLKDGMDVVACQVMTLDLGLGGPILLVRQMGKGKMTLCKGYLQVDMCERGARCDLLDHTAASMTRFLSFPLVTLCLIYLLPFSLKIYFIGGGEYRGKGQR